MKSAMFATSKIGIMKLVHLIIFFGLLSEFVQGKKSPNCSVCQEIVNNFHSNLAATAKSNYGGGNTNWEEKSLGSYVYSETRLVEIMEKLCDDKSTQCHAMLEKHEDTIEHFWFKEYAKKKDTDFHTFLCIEQAKACCHSNHYGPDCKPCPGGAQRPCSGNGKCNGNATRDGTGKCECFSGYRGDICNECKDGYYEESKNDTHTVCKVCHISCKDQCWEGGPKGCDECKEGWLHTEENGCQDINECLEDPCDENQYCTNTMGSHSCFSCDISCLSCTGSGPDKCNGCKEGFEKLENGTCADKDECTLDPNLCSKENEECMNTDGSYECICKSGFEYKDEKCVAISSDTETDETESSGDSASSEEDMEDFSDKTTEYKKEEL